ncbi:MAG: alkaline phosphatase [Gammaproteobacteria bacterium]|nr:alkaline phosphatase [Gammaproteobacteria bacterium]
MLNHSSNRLMSHRRFMRKLALIAFGAGAYTLASTTAADSFRHIATFDVTSNGTDVAEIVDATPSGRSLLYTDSDNAVIGFVDIRDPENPLPDGTIALSGEPTSVAVRDRRYALVGINTSPGDEEGEPPVRTGELAIIDLLRRSIERTIDLGGQPDSIAIASNRRYAAVAVENERNEDFNDGLLPQAPPGKLVVVRMFGPPSRWTTRDVDLTGLADVAPEDPEPEFVDINRRNEAIVTLQENNHIVVVDLRTASVTNHFAAGETTVQNVDATEEELGPQEQGLITFVETLTKRREPDTITWIGDHLAATANEGDYEDAFGEEGGSRGFTVFDTATGAVVYESAELFEHASARAGHYNEGRSANKGGEPEAAEYGEFRGEELLFIGSERANVVGVYDASEPSAPVLNQLLATGSGPEGIKALRRENLLAIAAENSEDNFPSMITLYRYGTGAPTYPQIESLDDPDSSTAGVPIPWVAQSGLTADPNDPLTLYSVSDSFLAQSYLYTIDISAEPAAIVSRTAVGGPDGAFDLEGIAAAPEGGFWLASEGRNGARPNQIIKVSTEGTIESQVELPDGLVANATNSGLEGIAVTGDSTTELVYVVVQREWDDDPDGEVKIGRYDVGAAEWTFVRYPLDGLESPAPEGAWVGLSEIALLPNGTFAIIERDNLLGTDAQVKRIYRVDLASADFRPWDDPSGLATIDKTLLRDVLGVLETNSVWTPDKLEGLAISPVNGAAFIITDNDGLDDAIGQTVFVEIGALP